MQSLIARLMTGLIVLRHEPGGGGGTPPDPNRQHQASGQGASQQQGEQQQGQGGQGQEQQPADQRVPYDRFQTVAQERSDAISRAQTAERERDEARQALTQRDREGMSELDRVRAELDEIKAARTAIEAERDEARQAIVARDRRDLVRAAATRDATRFHDPEDAIAQIDLADVKTASAAERAVDDLARRKPHLVQPADQGASGGLAENIAQVLSAGERVPLGSPAAGAGAATAEPDPGPARIVSGLKGRQPAKT